MNAATAKHRAAIGVFDSGVGGLSVLRALRAELPHRDFVYLGDTARLPYGTKSAQSVIRYSLQCTAALITRDLACLVVACNTASAAALPALRLNHPDLPVIGVIEPGARAAVAASRAQHIAVIGTEATIRAGAYRSAIEHLSPEAEVRSLPCPLFVALAEEGWTSGVVPEAVARHYLEVLFDAKDRGAPDTLVLGCTHFPALIEPIRAALPPGVRIVDSALTTAAEVWRQLHDGAAEDAPAGRCQGRLTLLATDGAERFARVGGRFLGEQLTADAIEIVDLGELQATRWTTG